MLRELPPFYVNNKKRLIKTLKYYIRDSGLPHHTLHIKEISELLSHPSIGASREGFVIEQVVKLGLDVFPYFYRARAGAECDLVLVKGNTPLVYIEAKVNEAPGVTKSLLNTIGDLATKENFMVTPSLEHPYQLKENVTVCDLPWLLKHLQKYL
ncbi:MAG: DUF4143 domain-containing protein [Bacteroidota bacterium]